MAIERVPRIDEVGDVDRIQELLLRFQPEKIPDARRIYANRNLRMSSVEAVGFDMDYTLAEYEVSLEELQIQMTIERLVRDLGYPEELKSAEYDAAFAVRGLIIDKRLGNLLKMDAHRHISRAFHGLQPLSKQDRRGLYRDERVRMSTQRFSLIDSAFGVPEAWLYAQTIDIIERLSKRKLKPTDFRRIHADIRETIDTIHADSSLKTIIKADIGRYVRRDLNLATMLHQLREAGKTVFLMTNSYGNYTQAVMSFLLDDARDDYETWRDYFDIMVVGSKKPSFFVSDTPFYCLDDALEHIDEEVVTFDRGRLYEGGNLADFERLAGVSGDRILYVGDNLYGDILRSKKSSAWRTAMIVPELEREIGITEQHGPEFVRRNELETHRTQIDAELHQHNKLLRTLEQFKREQAHPPGDGSSIDDAIMVARTNAGQLERALQRLLDKLWKLNTHLASLFNPNWGMVLKARGEHSVFGEQIEDYACVYTSRATNFSAYSPFQYYRTPRDHLPHERYLAEGGEPNTH